MAFVVKFGKPSKRGIQTVFNLDPKKSMGSGRSKGLKIKEQLPAPDPKNPGVGERGVFPQGVDTATPGYIQDSNKRKTQLGRRTRR